MSAPSTFEMTNTSGVRISFDLWDGAGRAILLVHGLASNKSLYRPMARALNELGYRVVAYDQRGHGRSSKPDSDYGFDEVVSDLNELVDYLQFLDLGWNSPLLVGQSWGASVVEEAARRGPSKWSGLVTIDGGIIPMFEVMPVWEECEKRLAPPEIEGMSYSAFDSLIRRAHPDWAEESIQGTLENMELREDGTIKPWLSRTNHMKILRGLWEYDPVAALAEIPLGTLMLVADDSSDHGAQKRRYAEKISSHSSAKFIYFPDGDHDLQAQRPHELAELIDFETRNGVLQ